MKQVSLLICAILSTGCMKIVDKGPKQNSGISSFFHANELPVRTYSVDVKAQIKMFLQSENRPGYYSLMFQFPRSDRGYSLVLAGAQKNRIDGLGTFYSMPWPHSQPFDIEIWKQHVGGPQLVASFRGTTPKDLVITAPVTLSAQQSLEAFRVFFLDKAALKIRNHNLSVRAYEVIAVSPLFIEGFNPEEKASFDLAGLSSGNVLVEAHQIFGFYRFSLRGQNGGDGSLAVKHNTRAIRGSSAVFGQVRLDPVGEYTCFGKSGSNGSGHAGAMGNPGKNGKSGGSGGLLSLNFKSNQYFVYEYDFSGGKAGTPSKGGEGQLGGLAGSTAASGLQDAHCGLPKMLGQEGPRGGSGPDGLQESAGQPGSLCLNSDNQKVSCLSI